MPRSARIIPGGIVYHLLNRRVDRRNLFSARGDYEKFEELLLETLVKHPLRIPAYHLMPNHFHMAAWPEDDGQVSEFMHALETTHAARWKHQHDQVGMGHLFQNRFKSFPVQNNHYYLTLIRYIERNALRANLVQRAEEWRYSSLYRRLRPNASSDPLVCDGPIDLPANWVERVNAPLTRDELKAMRFSVQKDVPYGTPEWREELRDSYGFKIEPAKPGRPKKATRIFADPATE